MKTKISVLMPAYNCEGYIAESVESVLNQSFKDFEFIIVDGGSTDDTVKIVRKYKDKRLKIIEHRERFGLVESLNEGMYIASGDIIARQDADDISHPQRLAKQYLQFCRDKNLAVLGTFYTRIDENGRIIEKKFLKEQIKFTDFKQGMQLCNGSTMFRKDITIKEGLYDPLFLQCEDYELYCRLSKKGYKIMNLPEFLYFLRVHPGSLSVRKWQEQTLYQYLVKEIYFGNLQKRKMREIPKGDLKSLYSLLSSERKKDYHITLAMRYMKSKKYLHGIREALNLIKVDPKELNMLMGKTVRANRKIFGKIM